MAAPPDHDPASILFLGLGNLLCTDEGLGVALVQALCAEAPFGVRALRGAQVNMPTLMRAMDEVLPLRLALQEMPSCA